MKTIPILLFLLLLPALCWPADPAPSCVTEQIEVQKLKQQNELLKQQLFQSYAETAQYAQRVQPLLQAPFQASQQALDTAKAEQARLEKLVPTPPETNPKQSSSEAPAAEKQ